MTSMKLIFLAMLMMLLSMTIATNTAYSERNLNGQAELTHLNKKLPRQDIQRFVTAIAVIHHYYIKKVSNSSLFSNAIKGMVSSLDPHSTFLDARDIKELKTAVSGKFVGVGIELTLKDGLLKVISPLQGSPAEKAGIKPNDIIIKVDGILIRSMSLNEAITKIKGKKGTKVTLTILRKGVEKPLDFVVTRNIIKLVSVKSKILTPGYGYVRITFFQGPVAKQLIAAIRSLKAKSDDHLRGLVLDLRNNPGGLLDVSAKVADDFLDSRTLTKRYHDYIVYTKGRIQGSDMHIKATPGDQISGIPMVLLINGGSASASEIVAGALQDYKRAIILGTRSFGKGSVQTVLPVGKDSAIKLTTALYYTPAGRVIQARGITPNVVVPDLKIKGNVTPSLLIDEADFQHHLKNEKRSKKMLDSRHKVLSQQLKLAKEDYQLYEALLMLKGLAAAK